MKTDNWNKVIANNGFVFINDNTFIKIDQITSVMTARSRVSSRIADFYVAIFTKGGNRFQFKLDGEEEYKEIFKKLSNIITGASAPYRD